MVADLRIGGLQSKDLHQTRSSGKPLSGLNVGAGGHDNSNMSVVDAVIVPFPAFVSRASLTNS